jgi:hypothetical protein
VIVTAPVGASLTLAIAGCRRTGPLLLKFWPSVYTPQPDYPADIVIAERVGRLIQAEVDVPATDVDAAIVNAAFPNCVRIGQRRRVCRQHLVLSGEARD